MKLKDIDQSTHAASAKHVNSSPITYPDERLVAFLQRSFGNRQDNKTKSAIDIGFGSGRHLQLLIDFCFKTYGIEYTNEAIAVTSERFKNEDRLQQLLLGDYRTYEFDVKFDLVIAWGLIFYSTYSEIEKDLAAMSDAIKDNGRIILNFRTTDNWFYKLGKEVDKNSYLLDERAKIYEGYVYTFLDLEQIKTIISTAGLKIECVERIDLWKNQLEERNSWYICELSKK
ncbi:class I SAM-dependent methyltransferase [Pedobacter sp. B4-66]|uniref:class I SAM-dependent methyltransferase n=1 Tax=Pedobacter sp. B4-66 TaxID=2817280 RepID=UPI001BD96678|nr:class I SAM-dependent methyltransferase [Pedobacter sp. B4-66]